MRESKKTKGVSFHFRNRHLFL